MSIATLRRFMQDLNLEAQPRDQEWLQRLKNGDASVIAEIGERYSPELRLFCQRMVYDAALAEDIVQDVLMKCYAPGGGEIPTGSLRGWLYRVARNRSIDALRKMRPEVRMSALQSSSDIWRNGGVLLDSITTPAGRAIKADRARRVQTAIDSMEDDLRDVVIMYFFQGLSREEVAEAIGLSLAGAKARIARATRFLRERLASLNDSSV
jgi:RNA polymerase sigma-70 factor (ECF subfamily)